MTPTPSILRASDFGGFEPELKRAFRDAFHFAWDAGVDSPDELQRRRRFARFIDAAQPPPETQPPMGLELVRQCYDLQLKIGQYLWPEDLLRDELGDAAADFSSIGEQIAALPRSRSTLSPETSVDPSRDSADELQLGWRFIEEQLHQRLYETQLSLSAHEISRVSDVASQTRQQVDAFGRALSQVSLEGKNEVTTSERAEMVRALATSVERLALKLKAFCAKCVPPPEDEAVFHEYLERLSRALPVRTTYGMVPISVKHWTEVPAAALVRHRNLPERRAAVLQSLCVSDPEFFSLLPSTVRRDHRAPATKGGKNNPNWVLRGIAAALVLLELVDRAPDARGTDGKVLFETTLKRVDSWIRKQAASGFFFVNADANESAVPGGLRRSSTSMPLVGHYPMSSAGEQE